MSWIVITDSETKNNGVESKIERWGDNVDVEEEQVNREQVLDTEGDIGKTSALVVV